MKHHAPPGAIARARRLRRDGTEAERKLWRILRESFPELHFRRQVPIRHYIADFASHRAKLVIEVDGGQHGSASDAVRTSVIEHEGYTVVRFWNHEVLGNPEGVWFKIDAAMRLKSLTSEGRGRSGFIVDVERGADSTPTQPSPIEGEG